VRGPTEAQCRLAATLVGVAAVAISVIDGAGDGIRGAELVGYGLGALLFPVVGFALFRMRSRRAGLVAFVMVAVFVIAIRLVDRSVDVGSLDVARTDRAAELLSPLGLDSLNTPSGACLSDGLVEFDEASFDRLEQVTRPPPTLVVRRLRDMVIDCGVDRLIVGDYIDRIAADGASTDPYDRICMTNELEKPAKTLFHLTSNRTLMDLPAWIDQADVAAITVYSWRICIDGGTMVAARISADGGPSLGDDSVACLTDWFAARDERLIRLARGGDAGVDEALSTCLTVEDAAEYAGWIERD
jgi:hypothetical protein